MLKLIGDGVLAIFGGTEETRSWAGAKMRKRIGLPIDDVFYGNIGLKTRLDFTVIGSVVNEGSRIVALCRLSTAASFCHRISSPRRLSPNTQRWYRSAVSR